MARVLLTKGKTAEAYAQIDQVLLEDPNDTDAAVLQIVRLIEDEKLDEATHIVRKALGEAPDDIRLPTLAARAQELSGNLNLAGDRLRKAVRLSTFSPEIVEQYVEFLQRSNLGAAAEIILSEPVRSFGNRTVAVGKLVWGRSNNQEA